MSAIPGPHSILHLPDPRMPHFTEAAESDNPPVMSMTLRDWFAGQALVAMHSIAGKPPSVTASRAYDLADAMLAARQEEDEE